MLLESDAQAAIVLEDDAMLSPGFGALARSDLYGLMLRCQIGVLKLEHWPGPQKSRRFPLGEPFGAITGLAGISTDITDQFHAQQEIFAAQAVQVQRFDPAEGTWQTAPWARGELAGPTAAATFTGPLTVLVDDACAGTCELLAALLQGSGRGTVVAQSGTAGVAGASTAVAAGPPDNSAFMAARVSSTSLVLAIRST